MGDHKIYTGQLYKGSAITAFGKCRCGAVLMGQKSIDEHKILEDEEVRADA